ncbi:MAG: hypothetical protein LBM00_00765 [Deltaproteobacteria bacterium]|jgi:hypothetical protein|nr:hypothetical protein [Deltaproteobacteria bacterium]
MIPAQAEVPVKQDLESEVSFDELSGAGSGISGSAPYRLFRADASTI